jgi:hypothetical protein
MVSLPDDLRGELWRDVFIRHGIGTSNPGLPSARYRSTYMVYSDGDKVLQVLSTGQGE